MRTDLPCRHPGSVRLVPLALAIVGLTGCAASMPWQKSRTPQDREQYGLTADERITSLAADAKAARAGSAEEQTAFCRRLVAEMLGEHDPRVRCRILDAATEFDTPEALAICRGALQDPDDRVRMAACSAWGRRGGAEAIELLASRYRNDTDLDVRLRAIRALGDLQDAAAVPVLAKALEDSDPAIQYRAVASLKRCSGRDLGNDVNRWREWAADPEGSSATWSMAEAWRRLF